MLKHLKKASVLHALLLATLLVVFADMSSAQSATETPSELVVPGAETYLRAVPEIVAQQATSGAGTNLLINFIDAEFAARYPDPAVASFDALSAAYRALDRDLYSFLLQWPRWNQWLLLNWIQEASINLDEVEQFDYEEYTVQVERRDFDADGEHEWLLDVRSSAYSQLVVVARDGQEYRIIPSPLPYFSQGLSYTFVASGLMEKQLFGDLNADGIPEWVLAVGGYGANGMSAGHLLVLLWQNGQLVNVAPEDDLEGMEYQSPAGGGSPLFPYGVSISFEDEENDGLMSVIIRQEQSDNWGCTWTLRRVFDWDGDHYAFSASERANNAVRGCSFRAAEESMWSHDYQAASGHYDRAFTLLPDENVPFVDHAELERYATARLVLAYSLAGRHDEAAAAIELIDPRPEDSPTLMAFISVIENTLGNAPSMCRAAYEAFSFDFTTQDGATGSPLNTIVGYTIENFGNPPNHPSHGFPLPARAGCDPSSLAGDDVLPLSLPTGGVPENNPPPTEPIPDYAADPYAALNAALDAIREGDFQSGLDIAEQGLQSMQADENVNLALSYVRALTLEFAGQHDQAVAQYRALYLADTDSAWSQLAGLHAESISG